MLLKSDYELNNGLKKMNWLINKFKKYFENRRIKKRLKELRERDPFIYK
jgi:hypothetical protein